MSTAQASAIIDRRPSSGDKPAVTYRYAGDRFVLVEYGEMVLDLTLNFLVLAVVKALQQEPFEGLIEPAPGLRSILVHYDSNRLAPSELIRRLEEVHERVPAQTSLTIPSRLIRLPIAFDDSQSREAVERYIRGIRAGAPNAEGGSNIDYIVKYNGLRDRDELYRSILATQWWNAFTGFFPGLPFMFPLDARHELVVPKYNPTRVWTAEGAVGIGGPCVAIYPVVSPGGYQLIGRTLPIYDIQERNQAFKGDPILIKPGDRVRFERVEEDELLRMFDDVRADRYRYRIDDDPFDVKRYLEEAEAVRQEAAQRRRQREDAAARTPVP